MGTNQDAVQGAVVGIAAVVCALMHGAFNTLICIAIHTSFLLPQ